MPANRITTACTTWKSRDLTASTTSSPTPGQVNTVSVTTEPVRSDPAMMAKTVSGAMEALRRQCFQTTFHSGIPFTRASFTNSLSSTSSMDERTSRMMTATWNQPSVMAGRMRCWSPPRPEAGSQSSITAKIHISTMPSQKPGSDWPRSAMILAAVSHVAAFRDRRQHAYGQGENGADEQRETGELQRGGQALRNEGHRGLALVLQGLAEIALEGLLDEDDVLLVDRLVEAPVLLEALVVLAASLRSAA